MATDRSSNQPDASAANPLSGNISPAIRKRLQRCFERGKEVVRQENPDRDYAHTMFAECVLNDPANLEYVEAMLNNLQQKYNNNKRGARLKGFGGRSGFKKAMAANDWEEVLGLGLEFLKTNPWDVSTLRGLAHACQANHYNEVELRYLKNALDANAKDPGVNQHCAESLARMGQFDQAIACWHRIEELDKGNKEARTKISELTLAKTRGLAGVETRSAGQVAESRPSAKSESSDDRPPAATPTPLDSNHPGSATDAKNTTGDDSASDAVSIEALEAAVARDDAELDNYVGLADAYTAAGRYRDAFQTLKRALEASGGNSLPIREKLEDAQIRMVRAQVAIAEQRAAAEKTDEANDLVKRFRTELNRQELQVISGRTDRYPEDLSLKYELGIRLKRDLNYHQAGHAFEAARADPALHAPATLELGECFQHLKQYGKAVKCYQSASTKAEPGSPLHRLALYRVGVLAAALKNLETAQSALQTLVKLDPSYRDAAARLDKLSQIRDKE